MVDNVSNSMPTLAQSALSSLQGGFNLLDKGAAEIVQGSTGNIEQAPPGVILDSRLTNGSSSDVSLAPDPLMQGIYDTIMAKGQVEAGAAMLHVYNRTRDDLFSLIAPEPSDQ
jgi:hypothetical protein